MPKQKTTKRFPPGTTLVVTVDGKRFEATVVESATVVWHVPIAKVEAATVESK